jgi:hypothetical protein
MIIAYRDKKLSVSFVRFRAPLIILWKLYNHLRIDVLEDPDIFAAFHIVNVSA